VKQTFKNIKAYDRLNIRSVPHINLVQDLTKTDLPVETYDLAIIWHVLEHIVEDRMAIREIYRVLKENGHLLMSVPIYPTGNLVTFVDASIPYQDYEKVHGHNDHCRSCGLDYYKRFEEIGFTTNVLESYKEEDVQKYGLSKNHVVWCFSK
jgi:ubiquinone/menaquinone biosynthesis C-methylase UbiE